MDIYRAYTIDAKKSLLDDFDSFEDRQDILKEFERIEAEYNQDDYLDDEEICQEDNLEQLLKEFNV